MNRNSFRLFSGQVISQICDKMMTVGLIWVIVEKYSSNHSLQLVPWFLGISALPHLILAWTSGRWISRIGPLRTVVLTDVVRGGLFVVLAMAWPLVQGRSELAVLFLVSLISNFAGALFNPAILSLPSLVASPDRLQQLTALIDTCFSVGAILGPLISAVFYPWFGLQGLFLLNGVSYIFAAVLELGIHLKVQSTEAASSGGNGFGRIRAVLRSDSLVTFMLLTFLSVNLFLGPLMVFLPIFAKSVFGGTIGSLARLETSIGIGTVLGSVFLVWVRSHSKSGVKILTCMGVTGMSYLGFSLTRNLWMGSILLAVLGFSLSMANVMIMSLFQIRTRPENIPTVMSLVNLISVASLPVSMVGVGFAFKFADVSSLAITFSCILIVITFMATLNAELRCQT